MPARVGIDIGGSKMLMLSDIDGRILERRIGTGIGSTRQAIAGEISAFLASLSPRPVSIGIAVPGLVRNGRVEDSDVLPELVGWSPADEIGQGAVIAVLNDAEAALVEEASELRADATAAIVVVGTGIGAAFQIDGRICRGASGWAGELGYSPLSCAGEVRTLDQLASGAAILRQVGLEPTAIQVAAEAGDERVEAVLTAAGEALGLALATLVNLLNPELISMFGGTLRYPKYVDAALAAARRHSHPKLFANCTIRPAPGDAHLVARGAMRLARQSR